MTHVVYIDILFCVNFIINYIILILTSVFLNTPAKRSRMVCGALLGALYASFMFFPSLHWLYSWLLKILFSLSIILTSFGFGNIKRFIKTVALFFVISAVLAGISLAAYTFTGMASYITLKNGITYIDVPLSVLAASVALAYIATIFFAKITKSRLPKTLDCTVEIWAFGNSIRLNGFVDTGNVLFDPVFSVPVIIAEYGAVSKLIPPDYRNIFRDDPSKLKADSIPQMDWGLKFRLVSCSGAAGNGVMPAFRPDKLIITNQGKSITTGAVLVGVCKNRVSGDGKYSVLLHPALFSETNDYISSLSAIK